MIRHSPHILLIDDNRYGLIARTAVLEEQGYLVDTARCGDEALEKLSSARFDLIVTDFRLPGVAGADLVSTLRAGSEGHLPIVILSGYVGPLGLTVENTGADAVLNKGPAEQLDLVRAIQRLLKRRPKSSRSSSGTKPRISRRTRLA